MKKQIDKLIDQLADKTLSFGCRIMVKEMEHEIYGKDDDIDDETMRYFCRKVMQTIPDEYGNHFYDCTVPEEAIPGDLVTVLGHQITLGRVLELYTKGMCKELRENPHTVLNIKWIVERWEECGINKSLQQIIEETEWGSYSEVLKEDGEITCTCCGEKKEKGCERMKLTNPNAQLLFEFLLSIFNK